jgi:hypothetical protein
MTCVLGVVAVAIALVPVTVILIQAARSDRVTGEPVELWRTAAGDLPQAA